jgi:hypothetical protein
VQTQDLVKEYISRLFRQTWILATGGVGFIVSAVLEVVFPGLGINWVVYVAIFLASLIFGGYAVFADMAKERASEEQEHERTRGALEGKIAQLEERQQRMESEYDLKLAEYEERRPRIVVRLQDEANRPTRSLEIHLEPPPPRPDFDAWVKEKEMELLTKRNKVQPTEGIAGLGTELTRWLRGKPNPDYEREITHYLPRYRDFLVRRYEIILNRAFPATPTIENKGRSSASNITIEFEMPAEYRMPTEHQYGVKLLEEWELQSFSSPPHKPEPFISPLDIAAMTRISDSDLPCVQLSSDSQGPFYEEKDGIYHIRYQVEKLIPHLPKSDLEPFWIWLADIHDSALWKIPVRIYAEELDEPEEDSVCLEITVKQATTGNE